MVNAKPAEQHEAEAKSQLSKRPPFWDIYWPTFGLLALGAIGALIAIYTLRGLREQTKAAINAERAWVIPELRCIAREDEKGRWFHQDGKQLTTEEVLAGKYLIYVLKITNMGRTPAHILGCYIGYTCLPGLVFELPPQQKGQLGKTHEFAYVIAAAEGAEMHDTVIDLGEYMREFLDDIISGSKTAIFHGWVQYRHIFSAADDSYADFCYIYTPKLLRLRSASQYPKQR